MLGRGAPRWVRHPWVVAGSALGGCSLMAPGAWRGVLFSAVGLLPLTVVLTGMCRGRLRGPVWQTSLAGFVLITCANQYSLFGDYLGWTVPGGSTVGMLLAAGGWLSLLGTAVLLVLHHAPRDPGGVIDAALVSIGLVGPLWEFLVRPRLPPDAQAFAMVMLLIQFAVLGALLRISATAERARPAMIRLQVAHAINVVGTIIAFSAPGNGAATSDWAVVCWLLGYLAYTAMVLHPAVRDLTVPDAKRPDRLSIRRLYLLGAALALNPVIAMIPPAWGGEPDVLLLGVGTLLVISLVLARIGQLLKRHNADQQALAHQAAHDELTGLANRRSMLAELESMLAGAASAPGGHQRGVGLLYGDLDGFKPINDRLGHAAGDTVLRVVARRLAGTVRKHDRVGRLGGDEFLVACADVDEVELTGLAERIRAAVTGPIVIDGEEVCVGITVGTSLTVPPVTVSVDHIVAEADREMYVRKRFSRPSGSASRFVGARRWCDDEAR